MRVPGLMRPNQRPGAARAGGGGVRGAGLAILTSAAICASSVPVYAGPPPGKNGTPPSTDLSPAGSPADGGMSDNTTRAATRDAVDRAVARWRKGDWTTVRGILEPIFRDPAGSVADPETTELGLRTLCDATLLDPGLDEDLRETLAQSYVERLLDADPQWAPPAAPFHGPALYTLVERVREEREQADAERCEIDRLKCEADFYRTNVEIKKLQDNHDALQAAYDAQDVQVQEYVARNRAVALVPFGVGHFYNGRPGLGGGFLAAEAITGSAALGLLIRRTNYYGCVRTNGFAFGSLECDPRFNLEEIRRWRNAEQALMGTFLLVLLADVITAQATFRPRKLTNTRVVPRGEIDSPGSTPGKAPKRKRRNAKVTVAPTTLPGGGGLVLGGAF